MPESRPSRLGAYEFRVADQIGHGGESKVYKARCITDRRHPDGVIKVKAGEWVALKVCHLRDHENEARAFDRHVRLLQRLKHPNIVTYRDSFVERLTQLNAEAYCLVMELLIGGTLQDVINSNRPNGIPWTRIQKIFQNIIEALAYVGSGQEPVIHGDIKPANICVTSDGVAKLIDFGLARLETGGFTTTSNAELHGTWDYMAPEFARNGGSFVRDTRSDIFSLGVSLYQSITGKLPFPSSEANPEAAYFNRWLDPNTPRVRYDYTTFGSLNATAINCIEKSLAVEREDRYESYAELLADFRKIGPRIVRHEKVNYEYLGFLGRGGFGKVFHARRSSDNKNVAIKELITNDHARRFIREARFLQRVRHPGLVAYLDFFQAPEQDGELHGKLYLVLEYLEGMPGASLRDRIKGSVDGLDVPEMLRLFHGYLECLEELHRRGIVHRDIKPSNLYAPIGQPENGRIFDLGIAHDVEGSQTIGLAPGTYDYMAPEFGNQSANRGTPQSDIYSLGVSLYQALAKKLPFGPFPTADNDALIEFHRRSRTPTTCSFEIPIFQKYPDLITLLNRSLAHNPLERYRSARAMADEIVRILTAWRSTRTRQDYERTLILAKAASAQRDYFESQRHAKQAIEIAEECSFEPSSARECLNFAEEELRKQSQHRRHIVQNAIAIKDERWDDAIAHANEALKIDPRDTVARQALREAQQGKLAEAIEEARRGLTHRDWALTEKWARIALDLAPDSPVARRLREEAQEGRKREETSALALEATISQTFAAALQAAREALKREDWDKAEHHAAAALEARKGDADAVELQRRARRGRMDEEECKRLLRLAQDALQAEKLKEAISHAKAALDLRPWDKTAVALLDAGTIAERNAQAITSAIRAARAAREKANWDELARQAEIVLQLAAGNTEAQALREEAFDQKRNAQAYESAIKAARTALENEDWSKAETEALKALSTRPEDTQSRALVTAAQNGRIGEAEYVRLVRLGQRAWEEANYPEALQFATDAVTLRPAGKTALALRQSASNAVSNSQKFVAALNAAQSALRNEDWTEAERLAKTALILKPGSKDALEISEGARSGQALASAKEKERTVARRKRLLKWSATAVGLTVILGGMLVGGPKAWQSYRSSQAASYVERAKSLERESDWDRAIESYRKAAEWGAPVEPKVEELAKKLTERQASYVLALDNARQAQKEAEAAVGQKDYTKATADLNRALAKVREAQAKKVTPEAAQLEKDLRDRQESVEGLSRDAKATERAYALAMEEAHTAQTKALKALEAKKYSDTLTELETALSKVGEATAKKETPEAKKLKSDLEDTRRTVNAAITVKKVYDSAMEDAHSAQAKALKALEAKNYPDTLGELDTALSKVGEAIAKQVTSDATKLKSDLEDTRRTVNAAIAVNKAYDSAMEEARTAQAKALKALEAKNYPDTLKELDSSLSKVGEATAKKETPQAKKLKSDLEDTRRTVNAAIAVRKAYDSAMEEARTAQAKALKALEAMNYPDTLRELDTALNKVGEAMAKQETSDATKLKSGLEAMVRTAKEADATAKKDQEAYSAAMTDARKAQQEAEVAAKQKNYTKAAEDLKRALTKVQEAQAKNPTSEATQLKNQLEERQLKLDRAVKEEEEAYNNSIVKARQALKDAEDAAEQKNYTKALTDLNVALENVNVAQAKKRTEEAMQLKSKLEESQNIFKTNQTQQFTEIKSADEQIQILLVKLNICNKSDPRITSIAAKREELYPDQSNINIFRMGITNKVETLKKTFERWNRLNNDIQNDLNKITIKAHQW